MSAWEQIRRLWTWGVPIIAIAAALVSNPTEERHLQTLREAIAASHQVAASFDAAERADPRVRYVDLWLLSYTKRGHAFTTWGFYGTVVPIGKRGLKLEPGAAVVR